MSAVLCNIPMRRATNAWDIKKGDHMFGNIGWRGALALGAMLAATPAFADDASEQAILVLDASGSM